MQAYLLESEVLLTSRRCVLGSHRAPYHERKFPAAYIQRQSLVGKRDRLVEVDGGTERSPHAAALLGLSLGLGNSRVDPISTLSLLALG